MQCDDNPHKFVIESELSKKNIQVTSFSHKKKVTYFSKELSKYFLII